MELSIISFDISDIILAICYICSGLGCYREISKDPKVGMDEKPNMLFKLLILLYSFSPMCMIYALVNIAVITFTGLSKIPLTVKKTDEEIYKEKIKQQRPEEVFNFLAYKGISMDELDAYINSRNVMQKLIGPENIELHKTFNSIRDLVIKSFK